ncbi:MAG TPA: mechanosensitive ion channel family protein, partial [Solirubrobacteraceae bacterium]|nr:mechanosensitive ion channel family protein [Solirubrobacteraceae bacterium]
VDRAFVRGARAARAVAGERAAREISPVAATRVRFIRRFAVAAILLIGVMAALAQFGSLSRVATSVLASGALAAAVIGFAARQVLANAVAGVMLAITQPLRIGDHVEFEGESGTVEDVRLNYTYLRSGAGTRVVIPNERLASGVLHNDTIVSPLGEVEVSVWLPPAADADRALSVLCALDDVTSADVAEIAADGVRVRLSGEPVASDRRGAREATLRAEALRALRGADLLPG